MIYSFSKVHTSSSSLPCIQKDIYPTFTYYNQTMPVYNMVTNKWVSLPYPYNQKPSYWDSDSEEESIDYPSSDDESEEESPPPKESTPIQRSQALRKEILKILKR